MKLYINILLVIGFISLVSCNDFQMPKASEIEIENDTLIIDIKGRMGQIIKYNEKYYCYFHRNNPYSSKSFKDFYILTSDGRIENKIEVPEKLDKAYFDLHVRNNRILTKEYWNHNTFYLDTKKLKWIETEEVDDLIFEDENYYITFLDFGEWGSTTWFKDKKTKKEYEFSSGPPTINKINKNYFLTNGREVFEINPLEMMPCDSSYYYNTVESSDNHFNGSEYINGGKFLFKDTLNPFESDFYIATSFVFNDSLFHICVDRNNTFLAKIEDEKIIQIKNLAKDIYIYKHHYAYRGNQFERKNQLLKFQSKNQEREGFIEIIDNKIRIIDVNNLDSLKILGEDKSDSTFQFLTDYQAENIDNILLQQIDSIIPKLGGYNVTPLHKISIGTNSYPNKNNFELETPRVYKIIEDSTITLLLDYYYTKTDNSIKVVTYEWRETWEDNYNIYASEDVNFKINQFQNRLNKINDYIKSNFGEPTIAEKKSNSSYMEWETKTGLMLKLSWNNFETHRRIRMKIYKE